MCAAPKKNASPSPKPANSAVPEAVSWDDLRFIEALDRLGSTRKVGRELKASASTVYRRIAALEAGVGARCVESGESVRLTPTGKALAQVARQTSASIAQVSQLVRAAETSVSGQVRLTTTEGFLPLITPPLVHLSERHPDLQIALHIADQGPSVRRREVDIALSLIPSPPPSLFGRKLFTVQYGVYGVEAAIHRTPLRWLVRGPTFSHPAQVEFEQKHVASPAFVTANVSLMMALVRSGAGVAILPRRLAALEPTFHEVVSYRPDMASLDRVAWILTHPDIQSSPPVRAVMDALVAALT
ncbi:MAG: LysR family transcriptional regulator [Polyangiaceae bacterium]|nr:LysR family transcriptional regulator [Polyangiaceae bacterium]